MIQGAITALITPFRDGKVDDQRLRDNVEFQIENGIDGLVPTGTTGESPTLDHNEHDHVIDIVVQTVAGRVPVIAGTGSNSTDEALRMTRHAREVGAAMSLQVAPYYNKPTQEGLYAHFMAIADQVDLPMMLYNIPGRSVVNINPETIVRLASHPNIVAVKEATGNMDMASAILNQTDLLVFSGDDSATLPLMSVGAKGVVSVTSNILPSTIHDLCAAALAGDFDTARTIHHKIFPLCQALFAETSPAPIKHAMKLIGSDTGELRLPLTPVTQTTAEKLQAIIPQFNLQPTPAAT